MALATCGQLVEDLCRCHLLDAPHARLLTDTLVGEYPDPQALADELLRRDWLTAYQVQMVLRGRATELVCGPFVLLERLGEGGMGQVFKARHRALGRIVALKRLRRAALVNPVAVPRFEREVRAAARLTHPNVVRAFDAGQSDGTYYLAMEFMEGVDLFQLIQQGGPLPVPQAVDYLRQAALGLQHAHESGFIHRDIKPANLFVTHKWTHSRASSPVASRPASSACLSLPDVADYPWGIVKILDFGLARLQDPEVHASEAALTQLGAVMGTPDFLAPEQAFDSSAIDIRADLYSLGCTLYFLLTGRVPFPGGSLSEKLVKHRSHEPDPVEQTRRNNLRARPSADGEVPAAVGEVVRKLMAKRPQKRYQTPLELAEALAALQPRSAPAAATPLPSNKSTCVRMSRQIIAQQLARAKAPPTQTTVIYAAPMAEQTTQPMPPGDGPRKRTRGLLVFLGFVLCCTLAGAILCRDIRVGGEPVAQPEAVLPPRLAGPDSSPTGMNGKAPATNARAIQP
jgi:serine/threonine-protein kinase